MTRAKHLPPRAKKLSLKRAISRSADVREHQRENRSLSLVSGTREEDAGCWLAGWGLEGKCHLVIVLERFGESLRARDNCISPPDGKLARGADVEFVGLRCAQLVPPLLLLLILTETGRSTVVLKLVEWMAIPCLPWS